MSQIHTKAKSGIWGLDDVPDYVGDHIPLLEGNYR